MYCWMKLHTIIIPNIMFSLWGMGVFCHCALKRESVVFDLLQNVAPNFIIV